MPTSAAPARADLPPSTLGKPFSLIISRSGRRTLSPMGTILVSTVTATVVVAVAFYVFLHRQPPPGPLASPRRARPPSSCPCRPPPPSRPHAAPTASAAAPRAPRICLYGFGIPDRRLAGGRDGVRLRQARGPRERAAASVRCGRLGSCGSRRRAPSRYPEWVSAGETVVVACQGSTRIEMGPATPRRLGGGSRRGYRGRMLTQNGKAASPLLSPSEVDRTTERARFVAGVEEGLADAEAGRMRDQRRSGYADRGTLPPER